MWATAELLTLIRFWCWSRNHIFLWPEWKSFVPHERLLLCVFWCLGRRWTVGCGECVCLCVCAVSSSLHTSHLSLRSFLCHIQQLQHTEDRRSQTSAVTLMWNLLKDHSSGFMKLLYMMITVEALPLNFLYHQYCSDWSFILFLQCHRELHEQTCLYQLILPELLPNHNLYHLKTVVLWAWCQDQNANTQIRWS